MKKMKKNIKTILSILLISVSGVGFAQTEISLEEAYKKALEHNLDVKNAKLRVTFQDKIKNSGTIIDPLSITTNIGQYNSDLTDYGFGVSQTFRFPGFYKKQRQVIIEEWKRSLLATSIQEWQLKREISLVFSQLNYLDEKTELLHKMDSIYTQYFNRADLRLKKGESNLLEKSTAENLKAQTNIQLNNIQRDKEIAIQQLRFLINDGNLYTNQKEKFRAVPNFLSENQLSEHWVIQQLEQQKNMEIAKLSSEKAKLLPSFSIGYYNTNMTKDYGNSTRLHSATIGLNIPIFNIAQKAVIEGQKINQRIAENNKEIGIRDLKRQFAEFSGNYEKLKSEVQYYEQKGLENSEQIISTANRQLYQGEINFLEWTILVNQALDIQNLYIERVKSLNDRTIEMNALFNGF